MEYTMTESKMDKVLAYSESATCDFKWEIYRMEVEESKISFLKDILSMANTIREESAYIIIGVKQQDGINVLQNVDTSVDENQFVTFIKGVVGPEFPEFAYYTMKYGRYTLGVFEIGISKCGPFFSKRDYGDKVRKQTIYYRYGSSNTVASDRMIAEITEWMREISNDHYINILEQVESFDTEKNNYILFLGEDAEVSSEQYELLGRVKWSMIIDMTKQSEVKGVYKKLRPILEKQISIHLLTVDNCNNIEFYEGKSLLWFMAGGEQEQDDKNMDNRLWTKKYFQKICEVLSCVANGGTKSIIYVDLFNDKRASLVETIVGTQESYSLFFKYITIKWNNTFSVTEESGYIDVQGTLQDIFMALRKVPSLEKIEDMYRLPDGKGDFFEVNDISWIHEELEPLYENIEHISIFKNEETREFYRGGVIAWDEMNICKVVEREKYRELVRQIETVLEKEEISNKIIKLDYRAGAGATTVLRMIGWYFHESYPVIFIRKYSAVSTIERIKAIYHDLNKSKLLLLIDEVTIDSQSILELKNRLLVEGIHFIILYSNRHLIGITENCLKEQLERGENKAFFQLYMSRIDTLKIDSNQQDERRYALQNLKDGELAHRTPFMYALTTYEKDFVKISDYVVNHLINLNEEQENIFKIISVIQYFTGHDVPLSIIENELVKVTGRISIRNKLTFLQKELLVFGTNDIRIVHHCVSEQILKYLCGQRMINKEAWRNNLEDVFNYVISVFKKYVGNDIINEIVTLLFLKKADEENKHFSYAIEALPEPLAKKRVLNKLKETFPNNAYVYSNLARFYHYIEENAPAALAEINQAINIHEDYTFFHFKGVILAKEFSSYIENNALEIRGNYNCFVEKVNEYRENVINAYDKSIELKYDNSYAYGSKINFYLDIIRKFQKLVFAEKRKEDFFKNEKYYWCTRFLAEIDETLKEISVMKEYTDLQFDEENYQNQVLEIQGDTAKAINAWDNMLTKNDVYRPNIRKKLVSGYYTLYNQDWNKLPLDKVIYLQKILRDNILEESDNAKNILQWFDFSRYFKGNLIKAVEYFSTEVVNPTPQFYFYSMVVFTIYGISRNDISSIRMAEKYCKICENKARNYPYRANVREFYNPNKEDICAIERYLDLKEEQERLDDILSRIGMVEGRIDSIDKPEIGWVKIKETGFRVKFNPSWNQNRLYRKNKDENALVKFVLGFRYEGPYAYNVQDME